MSSEQLADGVNPLDAELAATWDVLKGYSGRDTDLGIARRFGGAAAAYSLRDIGAMNGRVVKVRRDVDGDGTDKEEDFSANQVQSGALEDWVNGKLESTLPADVATAAAAYSLRKVKADYGIPTTVVNSTENFPSTVPLSGSAADIGNGFIVHRFADGVADSGSVTVSGETITVTAIASGTGVFSAGCRIKGLSDNKQYTVSGEFRVTSQGADGDGIALVDISDATAGTDEDSITTSSTTFTPFFIDAGYNSGSISNFVDLQANSNGSNSGTITAEFRNVQIIENNNSAVRIRRSSDDEEVVVGFDADNKVSASSPVTATPSGSTSATTLGDFISGTDAFVHTWYDQAGVNNAVQDTAANQPKIAESGALLADGIDFDSDFLQTSSQVLTGTHTGANSMYAVIKQTSADNGYICGSADSGGAGSRVGQSLFSSNTNDLVVLTDGVDNATDGTLDNIARLEGVEYLISANYSNNNTDTLNKNANDTGYANGTNAYTFSAGSTFSIGTFGNSTVSGNLFDGSMKEIIIYDSDQTDNRFKIESNINNYYGLYTFQGDGFVETWYDQSGNGNNATQSIAGSQPHIVRNGSITTLNNGNPAVFGSRFDSSNNKQLVMNSAVAEPTTIFATYYMDRSFIYLCAGAATGGAPRIDLNTNGIEVRFTTADDMGNTSVDNTEDSLLTLFSAENGGTAILRKDGTQIDTLTRTEAETDSVRYIFRGQSNVANKGIYLESFIVYDSDRTSDFEDIENDLKRANNIS